MHADWIPLCYAFFSLALLSIFSFWILKKRTFVTKVLLIASFMLIWVAALLIFYKIKHLRDFTPSSEIRSRWDEVMVHFDITGVIIGITGIIIGVLIYLIVDNSDSKYNKKLSLNLDKLDANLIDLKDITDDVRKSVSSVVPISSFVARLEAIEKVILEATKKNNELYILSYSPNYGKSLMHNLKVIRDEAGIDIKDSTHSNYYKGYNNLKSLREKNEDALTQFASENPERIHLAMLRSELSDTAGQDKFSHFLRERVLQGKKIVKIVKGDTEKKLSSDETGNSENVFILPSKELPDKNSGDKTNENELITLWVKNIVEEDIPLMTALKTSITKNEKNNYEKGKRHIISLDYVPMQFYLSIPDSGDSNYFGLIIFTNYYDLGQQNSVVSFSTRNRDMIMSFKDMFNGLCASQERADIHASVLKKLFNARTPDKLLTFIIKKELADDTKGRYANKYELTPVVDVAVKDRLEQLFDKINIPYSADVEFTLLNDNLFKIMFKKNALYISIGLFFNPTCQYALTQNCLFKLIDPSSNSKYKEGDDKTKYVEIADGGNLSQRENITYSAYKFSETFFSGDVNGIKEHTDHAIVSRLKIEQANLFILGGIDRYGTEQIINCLSCQSFKAFLEKLQPEQQFIAIFEVNKDPAKVPILVAYSHTELNGVIVYKNPRLKP